MSVSKQDGWSMGGKSRLDLLAHHASKRLFQRLPFGRYIFSERLIHHDLIAAASGSVNLILEPIEDISVNPDGDARLPRRDSHDGSALTFAEIVFFFHSLCSVLFPFFRCGLSGRDNSDIIISPGEDHDQEATQGVHANGDEPLFVGILVLDGDRQIVLEDHLRVSKPHAMPSTIRRGFLRVPFKRHVDILCTVVQTIKGF